MSDVDEWNAEFEKLGVDQVTELVRNGIIPESKRQAGFRWLGAQALKERARDNKTFEYVQHTYYAAVAAVVVGVIGIVITLIAAFLH